MGLSIAQEPGRMKKILSVDYALWLGVFICGAFIAGIYYSTYSWLILHDWPREDYNYCYLIPFVTAYLIWEKRREFVSITPAPSWTGMVPLAFGLLLFWLGELAGEFFTLYISSWFVTVGMLWMILGWKKIRSIFFALVMLLTMFPPPHFINTKISVYLKLISSKLGVFLMHLYGLSVYREGNIIDLGFTRLQVVDACSGLRYLIPLIVLGILIAYFYRVGLWKKAVVVVSTIPLAIVTNSLRIALTGILYEIWGARVAEGFFHGFSGWFIFMFSVAVLLLEMWFLRKIPPRSLPAQENYENKSRITKKTVYENQIIKETSLQQMNAGEKHRLTGIWRRPQHLTVLVLLIVTFSASYGIEFREKIPLTKPLDRFPLVIGDWNGRPQQMAQKFIDELDLSDYTIIDYKNMAGRTVNFYVAYYESQRKGESIHSPDTCLPMSGWLYKESGTVAVSPGSGNEKQVVVNRAYIQKGESRQLVYHWYLQRGRVLAKAHQLKIYLFWDSLTKHRTDGALVRLITPVYDDETVRDSETRLQEFMSRIMPVLDQYIPGRDAI